MSINTCQERTRCECLKRSLYMSATPTFTVVVSTMADNSDKVIPPLVHQATTSTLQLPGTSQQNNPGDSTLPEGESNTHGWLCFFHTYTIRAHLLYQIVKKSTSVLVQDPAGTTCSCFWAPLSCFFGPGYSLASFGLRKVFK